MAMKRTVVQLDARARLSGRIVYARDSSTPVHAFLGVPYALPPTGKRRFKAPLQHPLWEGVQDAIKFGDVCPQNMKATARSYGAYGLPTDVSEDCLYLNVWTPSLSPQDKRPVMVWIYGGSFTQGFSNYYDGTAWSTLEGVVFVSINYRIGALGFLPQLGLEVHANCGLLDQVEALRWVQKYISCFGGDPRNVTVFGESAGGISTSLHCLSPLTRGLFRRAICQSGTGLYPTIVWKNEGLKKYLRKRLQAMGCTDTSDAGMTTFLQKSSAEDLVRGINDGILVHDGVYITQEPQASYANNDVAPVEMLLGVCSHEGITFLLEMLYSGKGQSLQAAAENRIASREQARMLVEVMVDRMFFRGRPGIQEVLEAIMQQYFGPEVVSADQLTAATADVYGDVTFMAPTLLTAELHSAKNPTYLYMYDHQLSVSRNPKFVTGASHGEDIPVIVGEAFLDRIPHVWSDQEQSLIKTMMKYWAQFARTGDPNCAGVPHWPKFVSGADRDDYLRLNSASLAQNKFGRPRAQFWNKLIPQIQQRHENKAKY